MIQWTPGYCCNFLPKIIKDKHIFEQDEEEDYSRSFI